MKLKILEGGKNETTLLSPPIYALQMETNVGIPMTGTKTPFCTAFHYILKCVATHV
jgi:hypothetical protein